MFRRLYFSHYSPPARAVYMLLKSLKLSVTLIDCDILSKKYLTPQFLKINPQHTIPTLDDEDFIIWDSHAIGCYLAGRYGDDTLYPNDLKKRALIDQRLHFDTGVLYPNIREAIFPILFQNKTGMSIQAKKNITKSYNFLERFLDSNTWLAGKELTLADFSCIASISTLDYMLPITKYTHPNLAKYLDQCRVTMIYYEEANQTGLDLLGKKIQERLVRSRTYYEDLRKSPPLLATIVTMN